MLEEDDLRKVDRHLLDYLSEGRVTPSYARNRLEDEGVGEYTRGYIQQRLSRFEEHDYVENKGGGLYELIEDPRKETEDP